ncbi:MAG TPA: hypothetical protein VGR78_18405, partial [Verrucomicrobiae bacterium]|nr:hypothetical protein [Verrucomicrobiae bacterium]
IDTNGIITWTSRPSDPATNSFSVMVSDNGTPRLSAVQSFNVILSDHIAPTLSLATSGTDSHSYVLSLVGTPGAQYVGQYATNLGGLWLDFATNVAASDGRWSVLDPSATNRARFYRARAMGR